MCLGYAERNDVFKFMRWIDYSTREAHYAEFFENVSYEKGKV